METYTEAPGSENRHLWKKTANRPKTCVENSVLHELVQMDTGMGVKVNVSELAAEAVCSTTAARGAVYSLRDQGFLTVFDIDGPGLGVKTNWPR